MPFLNILSILDCVVLHCHCTLKCVDCLTLYIKMRRLPHGARVRTVGMLLVDTRHAVVVQNLNVSQPTVGRLSERYFEVRNVVDEGR